MKRIKSKLLALSILAMMLGGCSSRYLDFTLISSKNIDISKGADFVRGKGRVEGKDMVHWIIIIPAGTVSVKEALDRAIEGTPGCVALLDGVIYSKFWWIPYVYGKQTVIIEGTPLIDPNLGLNQGDLPTFGKIEIDKSGAIKSIGNITEADFYAFKNKIVKDSKEKKFMSTLMLE